MLDFKSNAKEGNEKRRYSFMIDPDLYESLRKIAFDEHTSVASVIQAICTDYIDREGE